MYVAMVDVPTIPKGCEYAMLGIRNQATQGWQPFNDLRFFESPDKRAMDAAEDQMHDNGIYNIWRFAVVHGPAVAFLMDTSKVRSATVGDLSTAGTFNSDILKAVVDGLDKVNYDRDMAAGVDRQDTAKAEMHFHKDGIPCYQVHK